MSSKTAGRLGFAEGADTRLSRQRERGAHRLCRGAGDQGADTSLSLDKHRDCKSPVSSASHLRLQHHSRQIGFGAHPTHGKIPARPLRGAGRGQILRCRLCPLPSRRAALYETSQPPALPRPVFPNLCSSAERAPGPPGLPAAVVVAPGGLGVCRRGRAQRGGGSAPAAQGREGTGRDGRRLPRRSRRPSTSAPCPPTRRGARGVLLPRRLHASFCYRPPSPL